MLARACRCRTHSWGRARPPPTPLLQPRQPPAAPPDALQRAGPPGSARLRPRRWQRRCRPTRRLRRRTAVARAHAPAGSGPARAQPGLTAAAAARHACVCALQMRARCTASRHASRAAERVPEGACTVARAHLPAPLCHNFGHPPIVPRAAPLVQQPKQHVVPHKAAPVVHVCSQVGLAPGQAVGLAGRQPRPRGKALAGRAWTAARPSRAQQWCPQRAQHSDGATAAAVCVIAGCCVSLPAGIPPHLSSAGSGCSSRTQRPLPLRAPPAPT